MVGPAALGEEIQNFVHDRRGIPRANGWDNQIGNELGLNVIFESRQRLQSDIPVQLGIIRREQNCAFLLFASVDGRVVLRDIFLGDNTFSNSHSVSKEALVSDVAYRFKFKLQ
ncbi:MAG: hypothetical protein CMI18_08555 [Opitutaceae bacterium]|nr:hypothetical protein [Opitutaceae bacterium]|tara:strand:- start:3291 stop:3629 length:339 start_codon:yes stop_codon:yes gene_type:complete